MAPLWRFLTFTRNYGVDGHLYPGFSHAWSLCVEEHFYLLLPCIILLLVRFANVRRLVALIAGTVVVGIGLRAWAWRTYCLPLLALGDHQAVGQAFHREIYRPTHMHLDGLLLGVSVALLQVFRPSLWMSAMKRGNWFLFGGLLTLGAGALIWRENDSFSEAVFVFPIVSIGYACTLVAALSPSCRLSRVKSRLVSWGAVLAYSLYLTHKAIISITHRWMGAHGMEPFGFAGTVITLSLVVAVALLLHFSVERPFLRLRERLTRHPLKPSSAFSNLATPVANMEEA